MRRGPVLARMQLRDSLGTEGVFDTDPLTGTVRELGRLDGYLTRASNAAPSRIAMRYVDAHAAALGLARSDVTRLHLRRDYIDIGGTHHLSYVQRVGGVPVFGQGLIANVAKSGRLISLTGSAGRSATHPATARRADAEHGREAEPSPTSAPGHRPRPATTQAGPSDATRFADGGRAQRVVFDTPGGVRAAWQTITTPTPSSMYLHVIDAQTGRVLYRRNLSDDANASGKVFDNTPNARHGGVRKIEVLHGLPKDSPTLSGNPAHVYLDVNDNNRPDRHEEVHPSAPGRFVFRFTRFKLGARGRCSTRAPVHLESAQAPISWRVNRNQNAVQVYSFVSKMHDHLKAAPIGFTRAAGNFEAVDGDAVQVNADDGAATTTGLPDPFHQDNANMDTPPDGMSPRMQMYLFEPAVHRGQRRRRRGRRLPRVHPRPVEPPRRRLARRLDARQRAGRRDG